MIVVVYDEATGAARSIASAVPASVPAGAAVYTLAVPYAAVNGYTWDAAARALVPRVPLARTALTGEEMHARIGAAAWARIASATADDVRAAAVVLGAPLVDVGTALVRTAAHVALMYLVTDGRLPVGQFVGTRAAWLAPMLEGEA